MHLYEAKLQHSHNRSSSSSSSVTGALAPHQHWHPKTSKCLLRQRMYDAFKMRISPRLSFQRPLKACGRWLTVISINWLFLWKMWDSEIWDLPSRWKQPSPYQDIGVQRSLNSPGGSTHYLLPLNINQYKQWLRVTWIHRSIIIAENGGGKLH